MTTIAKDRPGATRSPQEPPGVPRSGGDSPIFNTCFAGEIPLFSAPALRGRFPYFQHLLFVLFLLLFLLLMLLLQFHCLSCLADAKPAFRFLLFVAFPSTVDGAGPPFFRTSSVTSRSTPQSSSGTRQIDGWIERHRRGAEATNARISRYH